MIGASDGSSGEERRNGLVVVGALGQIGRALAEDLATADCPLALVDLDEDELSRFANTLSETTKNRVDVLAIDEDSMDPGLDIVRFLHEAGFQASSLVNGAYPGKSLLENSRHTDSSLPENSRFVSQHFHFFLTITAHFSSYFAANGGGSITNLSSMYGSVTPQFEIYQGTDMSHPVGYSAAKSAIEAMSRYYASRYRTAGVRINCVAPGGIAQNQPQRFVDQYGQRTMSGGMLEPYDVLGAIRLLSSEQGRAITGQTILVDDGFSIA